MGSSSETDTESTTSNYTSTVSDSYNSTSNKVLNWQNVGNFSAAFGKGEALSNNDSTIASTLAGDTEQNSPIDISKIAAIAGVITALILLTRYFK